MSKVRRFIVTAVTVGVLSMAMAVYADFMVFGNGVANGTDQASTDNEALNQAQAQANAICPTFTSNMETTADNCVSIGSDADNPAYVCSVSVKARCEVPQQREQPQQRRR